MRRKEVVEGERGVAFLHETKEGLAQGTTGLPVRTTRVTHVLCIHLIVV